MRQSSTLLSGLTWASLMASTMAQQAGDATQATTPPANFEEQQGASTSQRLPHAPPCEGSEVGGDFDRS